MNMRSARLHRHSEKNTVLAFGLLLTSPGFCRGCVNCLPLCLFRSLQHWVRKEEPFGIHGARDSFTCPFDVRKYSDQKQLGEERVSIRLTLTHNSLSWREVRPGAEATTLFCWTAGADSSLQWAGSSRHLQWDTLSQPP